jgi:hypothetical protein
MPKRTKVDINRLMREHHAIDRAVTRAFADAVRRHRAAGVPMVFSENGVVVLKDPFEVMIPDENGESDGFHAKEQR